MDQLKKIFKLKDKHLILKIGMIWGLLNILVLIFIVARIIIHYLQK